jgi:hypothetical protein
MLVEKSCARCKQVLPLSWFGLVKTWNKSGVKYRSYCNPCRVQYNSENDKKHIERVKKSRAKTKYKHKYGILPEDKAIQIEEQKGACAICQTDLSVLSPQTVHVDHCHSSGKLRGVLCGSCNTGLGMFKDSLALLEQAQNYLRSEGIWLNDTTRVKL